MIPSPAGWRIVVIDENESPVACPIVAWRQSAGWPTHLEPYALAPNDPHVVCEVDFERVVGYLPPGEEFDGGWVDAATELVGAIRENEERQERKAQRKREKAARTG